MTRTLKTCAEPGCQTTNEHTYLSRGLCRKHYYRLWKYGTTDAAALGRTENGAQPFCEAAGCGEPSIAKGLCGLHYARARRGVPVDAPVSYERGLPLAQRIMRRVEEVGDCWEWQGARVADGYGNLKIAGKSVGAHRVAYEAFVGPIPDGMTIDHICRNVACVNPAHLRAVTQKENNRRKGLTAEEHWAL